MKFVAYDTGHGPTTGIVMDDDRVLPLEVALPDGPQDVRGLVENWDSVRGAFQLDRADRAIDLPEAALIAPIPVPPRNIFCVGRNYAEHAAEFARSGFDATQASASSIPEAPVVFSKPYTSITGARAEIEPHAGLTSGLDYEAELGVVIGRGGRNIGRDQAMEHVWGYTIINDVTARDLQKLHKQWLIGKSLDTFCPMGPYVVTADEIGPGPLQVQCSVNGELRQDASTADLIFDIPTIIETLSAGITLVPGDIIATGTPQGVGIGFEPPKFLQPGDEVEITITGLGTMRNRVGSPR